MIKRSFAEELQRVVLQNPSLPVVPMVDTEVVGNDSFGRWTGKFGEISVTEYFEVDGKSYFLDRDNIEEAVKAVYGSEYTDSLPESKLVRVYAGLPWQKAVIVFVNVP